jgi:hypothetical protein
MVIVVDPGGDKHAYQIGRYIEVTDGHLIIRDAVGGTAIGIFGPGKWQSAHIDAVPARNAGTVSGIRPRLGQTLQPAPHRGAVSGSSGAIRA